MEFEGRTSGKLSHKSLTRDEMRNGALILQHTTNK